MLEEGEQPYVLAVRSNHGLRFLREGHLEQTEPAEMADALGLNEWTTQAAGEGSKGLRLYDRAWILLPWIHVPEFERWVLIRRNCQAADQRAPAQVIPRDS